VLKDSFRKLMVYVGLAEDDFDDLGRQSAAERPFTDEPPMQEAPTWAPAPAAATRGSGSVSVLDGGAGGYVQPTRPPLRPATPTSAVRPITTLAPDDALAVLVPRSYEDSKRIGDELKGRHPLVINLASADADLARRIIDFSSGVVYTLGGRIQRVAANVYLLVPPNTRVTPESVERLRLQGFHPEV
jgi:FtsZ-interacting cell division protein YlmF